MLPSPRSSAKASGSSDQGGFGPPHPGDTMKNILDGIAFVALMAMIIVIMLSMPNSW